MPACVLVVDDDPEFHALLRPSLEAHGYEVEMAATGDEALACLERNSGIAAAVVDLHLPGMSGFDLIREIVTRFPGVRMLAVSAIYREFYLEIAKNVGAHAARRKSEEGVPVSGEEWARAVADLLARPAAGNP